MKRRVGLALLGIAVSAAAFAAVWPNAREAGEIFAKQDDPAALSDLELGSALRDNQNLVSQEIEAALTSGDADLANSFMALAREKTIAVTDATSRRVADAVADENASSHFAKRFATGLITGSADDVASLSGTVAGDLFVFGDIRDAVREGKLREDLMYRLAVFPIRLPPLRERDGDAELLAEYFLQCHNDETGATKRLSRAALTTIRTYHWPGNVRELRNALQRAFIMSDDIVELDLAGLACPPVEGECLRMPIGTPLAEMERQAIFATLDHCHGNKRRAAEMLGVSLKTLYNRLAAYQAGGTTLVTI